MMSLFPLAAIITPNVPEASVLTGIAHRNRGRLRAGRPVALATGAKAVLVKGGHLEGETVD